MLLIYIPALECVVDADAYAQDCVIMDESVWLSSSNNPNSFEVHVCHGSFRVTKHRCSVCNGSMHQCDQMGRNTPLCCPDPTKISAPEPQKGNQGGRV